MNLTVSVLGDFDFIRDAIHAIARMFSTDNGGVFNYGSASLLVLFLFWVSLKQILDPEKAAYPFKEFVVGLVFWMIFAGPISPKFDVSLTSLRDSHRFEVINDVPMLAAVPAWAATNFFNGLKSIARQNFSVVSYSATEESPDPLGTLIKLYDTSMPTSVNTLGNQQGIDIQRSFKNYIQDCYIVDQSLDGAEPTVAKELLQSAIVSRELINNVRVDYNFIGTFVFLEPNGSSHGQYLTCDQAFTKIKSTLNGSQVQGLIEDHYEAKGITSTSIAHASSIIYGNMSSGPTPYEIQIGNFYSYMIRDGLHNSSLETFADKMVFEGMKKRLFERAGEKSLFNQIAIPLVTLMEVLTFFVAPWIMLLTVLGGTGLALIGKYLQLTLFMNMWGFIQIFVDYFTAKSVEKAFSNLGNDPLTFGNLPTTIYEIEGFLAISAAASTAVPMITMFMLFGGVHSLMGVMRQMTAGGVDASNTAPSIGSSMNNGTMNMGNRSMTYNSETGMFTQGHSTLTNQGYGSLSVGNATQGAASNTAQIANSEVLSHQKSFTENFTSAVQATNSTGSGIDHTDSQAWQNSTTVQRVASLAKHLQDSTGATATESQKYAIQMAGSGVLGASGIGAKGNISGDASFGTGESWSKMNQAAQSWMASANTSDVGSNGQSIAAKFSESNVSANSETNAALTADQQSIARNQSIVASAQNSFNSSSGASSTRQVLAAEAAPVINQDGGFIDKLLGSLKGMEGGEERLAAIGLGDSSALAAQTFGSGGQVDAMGMSLHLAKQLGRVSSGEDMQGNILDNQMISKIYSTIGNDVGGVAGASFNAIASEHSNFAGQIDKIDKSGPKGVDTTSIKQTVNSADKAGEIAPISNTVDTTKVGSIPTSSFLNPQSAEELNKNYSGVNGSVNSALDDNGGPLSPDATKTAVTTAAGVFAGKRWEAGSAVDTLQADAWNTGQVSSPFVAEGSRGLIENGANLNDRNDFELVQQLAAGRFVLQNQLVQGLSQDASDKFSNGYNALNEHLAGHENQAKIEEMAKLLSSGEVTNNAAARYFFNGYDTGLDHMAMEDFNYTSKHVFENNDILANGGQGTSTMLYDGNNPHASVGIRALEAAHSSGAQNDPDVYINRADETSMTGLDYQDTAVQAARLAAALSEGGGWAGLRIVGSADNDFTDREAMVAAGVSAPEVFNRVISQLASVEYLDGTNLSRGHEALESASVNAGYTGDKVNVDTSMINYDVSDGGNSLNLDNGRIEIGSETYTFHSNVYSEDGNTLYHSLYQLEGATNSEELFSHSPYSGKMRQYTSPL